MHIYLHACTPSVGQGCTLTVILPPKGPVAAAATIVVQPLQHLALCCHRGEQQGQENASNGEGSCHGCGLCMVCGRLIFWCVEQNTVNQRPFVLFSDGFDRAFDKV